MSGRNKIEYKHSDTEQDLLNALDRFGRNETISIFDGQEHIEQHATILESITSADALAKYFNNLKNFRLCSEYISLILTKLKSIRQGQAAIKFYEICEVKAHRHDTTIMYENTPRMMHQIMNTKIGDDILAAVLRGNESTYEHMSSKNNTKLTKFQSARYYFMKYSKNFLTNIISYTQLIQGLENSIRSGENIEDSLNLLKEIIHTAQQRNCTDQLFYGVVLNALCAIDTPEAEKIGFKFLVRARPQSIPLTTESIDAEVQKGKFDAHGYQKGPLYFEILRIFKTHSFLAELKIIVGQSREREKKEEPSRLSQAVDLIAAKKIIINQNINNAENSYQLSFHLEKSSQNPGMVKLKCIRALLGQENIISSCDTDTVSALECRLPNSRFLGLIKSPGKETYARSVQTRVTAHRKIKHPIHNSNRSTQNHDAPERVLAVSEPTAKHSQNQQPNRRRWNLARTVLFTFFGGIMAIFTAYVIRGLYPSDQKRSDSNNREHLAKNSNRDSTHNFIKDALTYNQKILSNLVWPQRYHKHLLQTGKMDTTPNREEYMGSLVAALVKDCYEEVVSTSIQTSCDDYAKSILAVDLRWKAAFPGYGLTAAPKPHDSSFILNTIQSTNYAAAILARMLIAHVKLQNYKAVDTIRHYLNEGADLHYTLCYVKFSKSHNDMIMSKLLPMSALDYYMSFLKTVPELSTADKTVTMLVAQHADLNTDYDYYDNLLTLLVNEDRPDLLEIFLQHSPVPRRSTLEKAMRFMELKLDSTWNGETILTMLHAYKQQNFPHHEDEPELQTMRPRM